MACSTVWNENVGSRVIHGKAQVEAVQVRPPFSEDQSEKDLCKRVQRRQRWRSRATSGMRRETFA